jgi:hypothetical protein
MGWFPRDLTPSHSRGSGIGRGGIKEKNRDKRGRERRSIFRFHHGLDMRETNKKKRVVGE